MKKIFSAKILLLVTFIVCSWDAGAAGVNIKATPLYIGGSVKPLVMLDISKDQQLYKKAYNDYSDLDGDGALETTYKHSIDYYGYFDSYKCYDYTNSRFEPASTTTTKYCSDKWAGNFLNWVAMSRMDAVRKLLYGGYRSTDNPYISPYGSGNDGTTVLERAYLPTDAHSWAKYYKGTDITQLVPNAVSSGVKTSVTNYTSTSSSLSVSKVVTSSVSVTRPSDTSTTATVALNNHGFLVGQYVAITGSDKTELNGVFAVATVPNANSFTYIATATVTPGGSPVVTPAFRVTLASGDYPFVAGDQIAVIGNTTNYVNAMIDKVFTATGASTYGTTTGASTGTFYITLSQIFTTGSSSFTSWTINNLSSVGISFCNLTTGDNSSSSGSVNQKSQTNTNPPLIRVAKGNFTLWGANERWQCYWDTESTPGSSRGSFGGSHSNGNQYFYSGIPAQPFDPSAAVRIGEYNARVKVCVSTTLQGTEKCTAYPNGNLKPTGLLQTYQDKMDFGLMTGSYVKNISGGVLRKNVTSFTNEVNSSTDGTFISIADSDTSGGIVKTLNKMRIYGYDYYTGSYLGSAGDNCDYQLTSITEGGCTSWGNPMSEIYFESLRYFAGGSVTTSYNTDDTGRIAGLTTASWSSPITSANYCAPLNALVFNASVSTNDDDLRNTSMTVIGALDTPATGTTPAVLATAANLTNKVGDAEGITGGSYFIGKMLGATPTATTNSGYELCTNKTVTALGDVSGICPEGPTLAGSYLIAGMAWSAHTTRIRSDLDSFIPVSDTTSLKVTTYGVQLSTNVPKISIPVPGSTTGQTITIQPAYRLNNTSPQGGGSLVDLKIVSQATTSTTATGTIYLNWEDSEQGGDYDQDMWGVLSYSLDSTAGTVSVTTNVVAAATANPQGFGYIITGTTKDGPHFHSGIYGFNYPHPGVTSPTDSFGVLGCNSCQISDAPTSFTYTISTTASTAQSLQDPLYYAAKYGGFKEDPMTSTSYPNLTSEWDSKTTTGASGTDGIPDNYFLVSNPLALETSLDTAFRLILLSSSASSVATNASSLNTNSLIYQARFNSQDWSGQLLAYPISTSGVISSTSSWDAAQKLPSSSSRNIITFGYQTKDGIPFRWSNISGQTTTTQMDYLNKNGSGTVDSLGSDRIDYLRGSAVKEGTAAGKFRVRATTKLGDIVYSNPLFINAPSSGYGGAAYKAFKTTYGGRTPMIYVGANDGMLHGFDASTNATNKGVEKIAYVPGKLYSKLSKLTDLTYSHDYYVDGSPTAGDVEWDTTTSPVTWKTVLVGGLNGGGRGYYALDITDPSQFTEANAASLVLWEFTNTDDADLGYSYSKPLIRKMKNGKWAVIFGNGYNYTSDVASTGHAVLYIAYLKQATNGVWVRNTDYFKIDTNLAADTPSSPNGLSTPTTVDTDGDGMVDYIYAGDLKGNMWKFDVTDTVPTNWDVAKFPLTSGVKEPLFTATDGATTPKAQPITSAPIVTRHPLGGWMVLFGTGKYIETSDSTAAATAPYYPTQSYYGIRDDATAVTCTAPCAAVSRSTLQSQTVVREATNVSSSGIDYRLLSSNSVNYTNTGAAGTQKGWYFDLPDSGERVVYDSLLRSGRIIFNTLVPSSSLCDSGGYSWLMELNYLTGARLTDSPFDVNNDGKFSTTDKLNTASNGSGTDVYSSGRRNKDSGIGATPTAIVKDDKTEFKIVSGTAGKAESIAENRGDAHGRISWRELIDQ